MAKVAKGTFNAIIDGEKKPIDGYVFMLDLGGHERGMGVWNNDGTWEVVDSMTGAKVCDSTTRKDAIARVESEPMVKRLTEHFYGKESKVSEVEKLKGRIAELEKELASANAATEGWKAKAEEYYSAKSTPKAPAPPKKEPTAKKPTKKPARKPRKQANEVDLEALLGTMREWCKAHPNTAANRRPGKLASVRVEGVGRNDEKAKDELLEMGFRWARGAQCWMYGEQQAEKQGKTVIDGR